MMAFAGEAAEVVRASPKRSPSSRNRRKCLAFTKCLLFFLKPMTTKVKDVPMRSVNMLAGRRWLLVRAVRQGASPIWDDVADGKNAAGFAQEHKPQAKGIRYGAGHALRFVPRTGRKREQTDANKRP